MPKADGSIIPVLYVALMAPLLAVAMVFYPLGTVFKGILTVSSLAGALGLSANIYRGSKKGPKWFSLAMIVATLLLYALSAVLFVNFLM